LDTALLQAFVDWLGNIDKGPPCGDFEPKLFAITVHVLTLTFRR